MIKVSEAVREVVEADGVLYAGLAQRLVNLNQVARHIHATVEAQTQKEVRTQAIAVALSRLQATLPDLDRGGPRVACTLTVQRGLAALTYPNTPRCKDELLDVQRVIRQRDGHLTISEGIRDIVMILEDSFVDLVKDRVGQRPTQVRLDMATLVIGLTREAPTIPGIMYRLLQPLALQGINVAEIASTTREFHVLIAEEDVPRAVESLNAVLGHSPPWSTGKTGRGPIQT